LGRAHLTGVNKSYSSPEVRGSLCSCRTSLNHLHRGFWSRGVTRKHSGSPQCDSCRSRHKAYCYRELCVPCHELTTVTFANWISDNITYYNCDVSKWEEVEAVAKKVIEDVRLHLPPLHTIKTGFFRSAIQPCLSTMLVSFKGSLSWTSRQKILGSLCPQFPP
jgi:hypothetical protein